MHDWGNMAARSVTGLTPGFADQRLPRAPKAALVVAQRIVQDINDQRLRAGDQLPAEALMLEEYGIGRGTLREALRLLEFQGVLTLKPGPRGGPVILIPDATHLASAQVLILNMNRAPLRDVVCIREILEPTAAAAAAERMDNRVLQSLADAISILKSDEADASTIHRAALDFHLIVAQSCGNTLLAYQVESLVLIVGGTTVGFEYSRTESTQIAASHQGILDGLSEADGEAVRQRTLTHLEQFTIFADRNFPKALDEVLPWSAGI